MDRDAQIAWEREGHEIARQHAFERARKQMDRGVGSDVRPVKSVLRQLIDPVADAFRKNLEESAKGWANYQQAALPLIESMDPHVVAFLSLQAVCDQMLARPGNRPTMTSMSMRIGRSLEDELRFAGFAEDAPGLFNTVRKMTAGKDREHRRTVMRISHGRTESEWEDWCPSQRLAVGARLLHLIIEETGMLEVQRAPAFKGKRAAAKVIAWTEDATDMLDSADSWASALILRHRPTLIPPREWRGHKGGGYFDDAAKPLNVVKSSIDGHHYERVKSAPMAGVYASLNRLQQTPWSINMQVLNVLSAVLDGDLECPALPPSGNIPLPPDDPRAEKDEELRRTIRRQRAEVYRANGARESRRLQCRIAYRLAQRLSVEPQFFYPYQLDFRGRIYPAAYGLFPQGPDLMKGLLQFGEAKPIENAEQAAWSKVHCANCAGEDKRPFADRLAWCDDNEAMILAVAKDPLGDMRWAAMEEPWQFLAAAMDYAGLLQRGYGYRSRLPVGIDGSCNGIQHYSALLRDSAGARATNLIPSETPRDIYGVVAEETTRLLFTYDSALFSEPGSRDIGDRWLEVGLTRKTTKRQVMVLPYGGTQSSCYTYTREWYMETWPPGTTPPFADGEMHAAIGLLSRAIWKAMSTTVVAAIAGMGWLRKASTAAVKAGVRLDWDTPSGFPAGQWYLDTTSRNLSTSINGSILRLRYVTADPDKPSGRQNANALPPNFVHSLDAAHLTATVNASFDAGVTAFAAVHDSFGTHVADLPILSAVLRETFVDLYANNDPLQDFADSLTAQGVELPPLPERGDFDIQSVLDSPYCFA